MSVKWNHSVALAVLVTAWAAASGAQPIIKKVEPPNWWPNHTLNPIRVLIHGEHLENAQISGSGPLRTSRIFVNQAGTYALVDVTIPRNAKPGDYPLHVKTAEGTTTAPFRLGPPLKSPGRFQGFSRDDVIYLIMPDRFANGDPSNDDPAISHGLFDRNAPRRYHGGDLEGIIDHLPYLKSLGITAIWITPVYDNTNVPNAAQAVNGVPIADYHGYGATDYYGVEEHFGDMATLRKLVDEAHRRGIKVIQDQVANHVGPQNRWVNDSPKPTWFHGTAAQHIDETWQVWSLPDVNASADLNRNVLDGWFQDRLPDMNQEDPDVAQYEIQNALWWVGMTGFDGIRQDTLPYVPRTFWAAWSAAIKRQYPNLRVVGEVFDGNPEVPSFFQGGAKRFDGVDSGIDTVFDFPTYYCIRDVFLHGKPMDACAKVLAEDRLYADPSTLVTFLGLHDVGRFMGEPGASVNKLKLAFTLLLTIRGTPMIYYGDEIGMPGGDDPDNRCDFPGGWPGDNRNAFESSGRTGPENDIFTHVQKLLELRQRTEALRRGRFTDLAITENTWAYARTTGANAAIVVFNKGSKDADVRVPFARDGQYLGQLGTATALKVQNGSGTAHLPPESAEIFIAR